MKAIFLSIIVVFLAACSTNSLKRDYKRLKSERIALPQYRTVIINGRNKPVTDLLHGELKLIVFCDSTSCNNCAIEAIYNWEDYIKYAEELDGRLSYYFIFTPRKEETEDVKSTLDATDFNYPIIFDSVGLFRRLNPHIPANKMFHTFLIDENGQVVFVGNPLWNMETENLFKTTVEKHLYGTDIGYNK